MPAMGAFTVVHSLYSVLVVRPDPRFSDVCRFAAATLVYCSLLPTARRGTMPCTRVSYGYVQYVNRISYKLRPPRWRSISSILSASGSLLTYVAPLAFGTPEGGNVENM